MKLQKNDHDAEKLVQFEIEWWDSTEKLEYFVTGVSDTLGNVDNKIEKKKADKPWLEGFEEQHLGIKSFWMDGNFMERWGERCLSEFGRQASVAHWRGMGKGRDEAGALREAIYPCGQVEGPSKRSESQEILFMGQRLSFVHRWEHQTAKIHTQQQATRSFPLSNNGHLRPTRRKVVTKWQTL